MFILGSIGGRDCPVEIARALGNRRRRQQLAIVQPAHCPVPFAHPFDPHIEAQQGQRPANLGSRRHLCQLVARRLLRARRGDDTPAKLFIGEVAVEIGLPGNTLEQPLRLVQAPPGTIGASQPVHPTGLTGQRLGHTLDGPANRSPIAGTQGGAHFPLADFVRQRHIAGLTIPVKRLGHVTLRGLPAHHAPRPTALTGLQFSFQTRQLLGCHARIAARHARHRNGCQLALHAALRKIRRQLGQPGHRRLGRGLPCFVVRRLTRRQIVHAKARGDRAVRLDLPPDARPDFIGQHALFHDQCFEHRVAAFRWLDQGQPQRHGVVDHARVAACAPRLHCITGNLLLRLDDQRILGIDLRPLLLFSELLDPVVTQFLGDVAALVALQESPDGRRIERRQIGKQAPVLDVGNKFVALQFASQAIELCPVCDPCRIPGGQKALIGRRHGLRRGEQGEGKAQGRKTNVQA